MARAQWPRTDPLRLRTPRHAPRIHTTPHHDRSGDPHRRARQDHDSARWERCRGDGALSRDRIPRFRAVLRGPALHRDGGDHRAHLRHLPGEPSAGRGENRRQNPGRCHSTGCRTPAAVDEPGATHPEPRPLVLSPQQCRFPPGLGQRSSPAQPVWPDRRRPRPGPRRHPAAPVRPGGD